ncbi:MAG: hypothetical protein JWR80_8179 [Bradyrhizobium sp.]|nr:hypothetical protein [Bradyrhizobium sp.]
MKRRIVRAAILVRRLGYAVVGGSLPYRHGRQQAPAGAPKSLGLPWMARFPAMGPKLIFALSVKPSDLSLSDLITPEM